MLEVLRGIVQEVNAARDLNAALEVIVERVSAAVAADVCSVYLTDKQHGDNVLIATKGLRAESVGKVRLPKGVGLVGLVAVRAEPANIANAAHHPGYCFVPETGEAPYHGFLGVPVILRRRVLGVLVVQQVVARSFTDDELSFMVTLAAQLAGIIAQVDVSEYLEASVVSGTRRSRSIEGSFGVRGLAIGRAVVVHKAEGLGSVGDDRSADPIKELQRFESAVDDEVQELRRLREQLAARLTEGDLVLFDAYALILGEGSLRRDVAAAISAGNWAPGALRDTIAAHARMFVAMEDPYLRGRAADIRDLGERLYRRLEGDGVSCHYPADTVLVGEELTVSDIANVPTARLKALVSAHGTSGSHVALLARGMGVPAVFGLTNLRVGGIDGLEVVVDGYSCRVSIEPGPALRGEYLKLVQEERELSEDLEDLRDKAAVTSDGARLCLMANTALFADIAAARHNGAEGIGLYRSEMHFTVRQTFPGEDEQTQIYRRVIRAFSPYPVTLRTLDAGGDKALPYFPVAEANPNLGWRGVRLTLDHPEIFVTQLRAMLRAGAGVENYRVMFPMVGQLAELDETLLLLDRARRELEEEGVDVGRPQVGLMVEVPAMIYQIDLYAGRVDFLSIGTNDLTQYILAVDRNNEHVANIYDGLHPAVLGAVRSIIEGASRNGCPVSVCGELAGDPAGAPLLVGLGASTLSMGHSALNKVKWVLRSFSLINARRLADRALLMRDAEEVRSMMNRELERVGVGGLIRAGR